MGGANIYTLIRMFSNTGAIPVTLKQLEDANYDNGLLDQVRHYVETYVNSGEVVRDGEHFWLSKEVLFDGLEQARAAQAFWQKRIEYLETAHKTLKSQPEKA
jgi:hypothetical protein